MVILHKLYLYIILKNVVTNIIKSMLDSYIYYYQDLKIGNKVKWLRNHMTNITKLLIVLNEII